MRSFLFVSLVLICHFSFAQVSTSELSVTPGPGNSDGLYTSAVRIKVNIMQYHRSCTGKVSAVTDYSYTAYVYQYRGIKYYFKNGNLTTLQNDVVVSNVSDYKEAATFDLDIVLNTGFGYKVSGHPGRITQQIIIQEDLPEFDSNGDRAECIDLHSFSLGTARVIQSPRLTDSSLERRIDDYLNKQQSTNQNNGYAVNTSPDSEWNDSSPLSNTSSSNSEPQPDYTKSYDGQKYVQQYATNGQSQRDLNNARAEQVQLQQRYQQRQQQQQAFEQSIVSQNQEAFAKFEQAFAGDQLSLGLAQSAQALGSAIGSGYIDNTAVVTGVANVVGGLIADGQRRREEEAREEAYWNEVRRIEAEKQAYINKLVLGRETALEKIPKLNYPSSTAPDKLKTAYFYGAFFQTESLKLPSPEIEITEIIAVNRYSDGTWPFETTTQEKLQEFSEMDLKMFGFYNTYDEANESMNALATAFAENAVGIQFLNIADKFDSPLDDEMFEGGTSGPKTDYWGNVIEKPEDLNKDITNSKKMESSTTADFWGETVSVKSVEIKATENPTENQEIENEAENETEKQEDDFWGASVETEKSKDK